MSRYVEKLLTFCEFSKELAQLSTCKRAKVGALVIPFDCSAVLAIGYNGVPRGAPNDSCTGTEGECGCAHAEANAMVKLADRRPAILICTHSPCLTCATLALNAGTIELGIFGAKYRDARGRELLERYIPVIEFDDLLAVRRTGPDDWSERTLRASNMIEILRRRYA